MDRTLIWLLIPGILVLFYILRVSAKYRHNNYDLEEYLLAGRHIPALRFSLATTTLSLLGFFALPHMGLFYRSGFSYGFIVLAAIIVPLTSAFFARRLWILGRIFNPLTPAQLLGAYYRSNGVRGLTAIIAVLIALTLTVMSLRLSANLMEGFGGAKAQGGAPSKLLFDMISLRAFLTMAAVSVLAFILTAFGGMGAIMRMAAPVGLAILLALIVFALVLIIALDGFAPFLNYLASAGQNQTTAPMFAIGAFYDPLPAAAPANIAWPGSMVATSLIALAGLAITPAMLMTSFTAAKGESHAPAQFITGALMSGLVLLTTTIVITLLARLAHDLPGLLPDQLSGTSSPGIGFEPQTILDLVGALSPRTPIWTALMTLTLLMGLFVSAAAALLSAGAMVANDIFYTKQKSDGYQTNRRKITRVTIGLILVQALALAVQKPDDPLPLFLLAGAFGLQLLPALTGLCYFKNLSGQAIKYGLIAGLIAVIASSSIPQGLAERFSLTLPFDAWPFSLHPAFWGLVANLVVLSITQIIDRAMNDRAVLKRLLSHRQSFHVLPDGKPLMAKGARFWQFIAWLIGALFVSAIALPLSGLTLSELSLPDFLPAFVPVLWSWQFLAWLVGLALVFVVAYKLQPNFDTEQVLHGSLDPQNRRFRVKAQTRIVEILPPIKKKK